MIYALPFPQVILGHVNPVKISSLMGSLLELSTGDGVIKMKIDLAIAEARVTSRFWPKEKRQI